MLALAIGCNMLAVVPADAQSDAAISARLDMLFGADEPYRAFLSALQDAVSAGDRQAVARMTTYPVETTIAGGRITLVSPQDVVEQYDRLFTPAVVDTIERQTYGTLFANAEGVMIGAGEIWYGGVCTDPACAAPRIAIIGINPPGANEAGR